MAGGYRTGRYRQKTCPSLQKVLVGSTDGESTDGQTSLFWRSMSTLVAVFAARCWQPRPDWSGMTLGEAALPAHLAMGSVYPLLIDV